MRKDLCCKDRAAQKENRKQKIRNDFIVYTI